MFEEGLQCGIIEQYVSDVVGFSSQYGNDNSISYTACNIIGKPTIFPSYGDFTQAYALKTYGPHKSTHLRDVPCKKSLDFDVVSQDFIDIEFEKNVFPFRVELFETYNPGAVVRIMAHDSQNDRWSILWSGAPVKAPPQSRIFSPLLRRIRFQTKVLRLEFYQHHLPYHYEIDAIRLVGSNLISFLVHSQFITNHYVDMAVGKTETRLDHLPGELLTSVFCYLDLESLCRCACVCRVFLKFCYDTSLYRNLNLQPYWHKVTSTTLENLKDRCSTLQTLTLNWCNNIIPSVFVRFIELCGRGLTALNLSCCPFITWDCLKAVADFCPFLTDLGLQNVRMDQSAFIHVSRLTSLRRLDLYRTPIDTISLSLLLRSCLQLESLGLGACLTFGDQAAIEISRHNKLLKHLDLWRAKQLSAIGIRALVEGCPLLEELDLGWCLEVDAGTGCIRQLVACCSQLHTLVLTSIRTLCDDDLLAIATYCKQLRHLDVLGSREISREGILRVLSQCLHLEVLDVSFCGQIDSNIVQHWKTSFPKVDIKRSFQLLMECG